MTSPSRRKELDVMKLMMNEYEVNVGEAAGEYFITFYGPKDSTFHYPSSGPYEGGKWRVRVELPPTYPFKSPSIGFTNRIYHPNVDEASGSVCLDVINQTWSPMFDLVNVFESFLPQLLLYPNPTDPLNGEAAALLLKEPEKYKAKVRDYVARFAADPNKGAKPAAVANGTSTTNGTKEKPDAEMSDPDDGDADIGSDGEGGGFFPK